MCLPRCPWLSPAALSDSRQVLGPAEKWGKEGAVSRRPIPIWGCATMSQEGKTQSYLMRPFAGWFFSLFSWSGLLLPWAGNQ